MRLTNYSDYALRSLIYLAVRQIRRCLPILVILLTVMVFPKVI